LIFTGNFSYPPNIDAARWLVAAIMPRIWRERPGVTLTLAGSDPTPDVRALAGDRVTVTGRVPDLRPYLRGAAVYLCPLRLGAGIKNKVLEALALGCPVVATPLSLDGIAARDGVEALVGTNEAELADAVLRLLADPAGAARLGAAGRALVAESYSWAGVAGRYADLYRTVADRDG
jgi:glycosyltransferase involved in cell wall biosynthesis